MGLRRRAGGPHFSFYRLGPAVAAVGPWFGPGERRPAGWRCPLVQTLRTGTAGAFALRGVLAPWVLHAPTSLAPRMIFADALFICPAILARLPRLTAA